MVQSQTVVGVRPKQPFQHHSDLTSPPEPPEEFDYARCQCNEEISPYESECCEV